MEPHATAIIIIACVAVVATGCLNYALRNQLSYRSVTLIALGWLVIPAGSVAVFKWADIEAEPPGTAAAIVSSIAIVTIGFMYVASLVQTAVIELKSNAQEEHNNQTRDERKMMIRSIHDCLDLKMSADQIISKTGCTREVYHDVLMSVMIQYEKESQQRVNPLKDRSQLSSAGSGSPI